MEYDDFDKFILSKMPSFIAQGYKKILLSQTAKDKTQAALYVFDLSIRSLAIGVVSQYLVRDRDKINDSYLDQMLSDKLPGGTLKTWLDLFLLTLKVYVGNKDLFFVTELYDFYWDTSVSPHQPRVDLEKVLFELLAIKYEIEYGNSPKGQFEWEEICKHTLELLHNVLRKFEFIGNYELIRIVKKTGNKYSYERHVGLEITTHKIELPDIVRLESGWFYLDKEHKDFLPLNPLLVFWENSTPVVPYEEHVKENTDVAIFERFTNNQLQYLLSQIGKVIEGQEHVSDFVRIIFETIRQIKRSHRELEKITWWQLREIGSEFSANKMATVQDRYNPKIYLQRDKVKSAFRDFLQSEKKGFILLGKSGVGKSNFILSVKDELVLEGKNICMFILDAANIDSSKPLTDVITQDFKEYINFIDREAEDIWHEIAKIDEIDEDKIVLLCIDAINENPNPQALLKQLNDLIQSRWRWLKIVITSRPESWVNIKQGVKLAERLFYRESQSDKIAVEMEGFNYSQKLEPFSDSELARVYELYKNFYNLKSKYDDLSGRVKELLRDPLVLWLMASIHYNQHVPVTFKVSQIIPDYINAMIDTKRLESADIDFLEKNLMPIMLNLEKVSNSINSKSIEQAGSMLFDRIHVDSLLSNGKQVNQSFVNLMDTEILIKRGDSFEYEIGFKYERFYDYFAARQLNDIYSGIQDRSKVYLDLVEKMQEKPFIWGGAKNLLLKELCSKIVSELSQNPNYFVRELLTSALIERGKDDFNQAENFLLGLFAIRKVNKQNLKYAKFVAVSVAEEIESEKVLLLGTQDTDQDVRVSAIQQIYKLLKQGKESMVFEILDDLLIFKFSLLKINILFGVIESFIIISFLILCNFFEDDFIISNLKTRWSNLVIKNRILKLSKTKETNKITALFRSLILYIVSSVFILAIKRIEDSKTAVVGVKSLNMSFLISQEQKLRLQKAASYLISEESIVNFGDELIEMAKSRDHFAQFATAVVFLAALIREKEKAIQIMDQVVEVSLNQTPPTQVVTATSLVSMIVSLSLDRFDESLIISHRKMLSGLINKSRCVVKTLDKEFTWYQYDLFTYYYHLHMGEDLPPETSDFIEIMEQDGKWEELKVFITYMADLNIKTDFVEPNVSLICKFLNHKNQVVSLAAIQSVAMIRSVYPLETDQLIKNLNINDKHRIAIENEVAGQNMGKILTDSILNFWSNAILHNDHRVLIYLVSLVELAVNSRSTRQIFSNMVNKVLELIQPEEK